LASETTDQVAAFFDSMPDDIVAFFHDEERVRRAGELLAAVLHEDFVCVMAGPEGTDRAYYGLEGLIAGWRDWLEPWESYSTVLAGVEEVGDSLLVEVVNRARIRDGGVEIEDHHAAVVTCRDDRLARVEFHLDPRRARSAIGL
jgi:ketosteroid isomerase-like protein